MILAYSTSHYAQVQKGYHDAQMNRPHLIDDTVLVVFSDYFLANILLLYIFS